jgi:hypothetical protein
MTNLVEYKQTRALKAKEMSDIYDVIVKENRGKDSEESKKWDALRIEIEELDVNIERAEKQEEINKRLAGMPIRNDEDGTQKEAKKSFLSAMREYIGSGVIANEFRGSQGLLIPQELRADPLLSSTNSSLVPQNVINDLSMVTGDNFTLLQALGVGFLTGLNGKTEYPYMVQLSTSKPGEGVDASTASASPLNVEFAPQAYSSFQTWSKQALLTTPDAIYTGILNDMQLANERKVVADLFTDLVASDVSTAATTTGLTYGDMINLTNIGYNVGTASFVTDHAVRVYLEQKAVNSNGIALAWNALNNTVGGRKAIASDAMVSKRVLYGNFAYSKVGVWSSPEIIVNPFAYDTAGKVRVTVLGFYCPKGINKYAFKHFSADASVGI